MRQLALQMSVTLDGYVAGEDDAGLPPDHPDLEAWKLALVSQAGVHIMGRVTYEEMAAYWPTSTHPYAAPMNRIPKVVFSKTLPRADWPASRIARGELSQEVAALKSEPGGDIVAYGGASFAQALARLNLIDEYRLVIRPVAIGRGLPLFKDLPRPLHLDLVEAKPFPDGTVVHVYHPLRT